MLVAKTDLLGIPAGEPLVSTGDIWNGSHELDLPFALLPSDPAVAPAGPSVVSATDTPECWYHTGGKRRKFVSTYAAERWG